MSKRRIIVLSLIIILILGVKIFINQHYAPPIAMYHSVNPEAVDENRLEVSVENFERQMRFLKENNYNVLRLEELADLIGGKKKISPRTIALTFDDGYKDNYKYVFPILKKYNLPATMFVIVNEIGRSDRLSWEEIKEMQESGLISLGSHCLGPEPLVNIKNQELLKKEIFESKNILEKKLGKEVTLFSYPEGRFNHKIKELVIEAGYRLAVTTSPGKKFADDDVFALKRLRISGTSNNLFVFWFETSGIYTFIKEHRDDD
jgi:peptidoglycan/xylan/chitin deacetylase (PgdA/CDA1 family)